MSQLTNVVVVGGGYAGVMAANRLTQRDDVNVTLINPRPTFVERIRLHQLVGGSHDAVVNYRGILARETRLVVDTVERINAADRNVTLATGGTVNYDYLVYAVGSGNTASGVPGVAEFAYPISSLEEAKRLRDVLADTSTAAGVTVVGGGPTGIETAAELAEPGRPVTLVAGEELGPYLHPRGRRSVARQLAKLGVTVLEGPGAKVTAVTRDAVELSDSRELSSMVTIWTAGFGVPDLAARSGLTTDAQGRLLTDETLTSVDDSRIVAAGDAAAPSDVPFRMSCQAAVQLGPQAADTVLHRIAAKEPTHVSLGFFAMCISLGRDAGILQLAHKNDTATRLHIGGRPGAKLKEFICKGTVWQMTFERRKPGLMTFPSWALDNKRPLELQARRTAAIAD